jgi:hypothetical protein
VLTLRTHFIAHSKSMSKVKKKHFQGWEINSDRTHDANIQE